MDNLNSCLAIQRIYDTLYVVYNGKMKQLDLNVPIMIRSNDGTLVTDLFTKKQVYVTKHSVPLKDLRGFLSSNVDKKIYMPKPHHVPLLLEHKSLLNKYKQKHDIKIMTLDIEVASKGPNPYDPLNSPIISIGVKLGDEEPFAIHYYDEQKEDYYILKYFIEVLNEYDPDIIMVYNAHYDIPYIVIRSLYNRLDTPFTRLKKNKMPYKWTNAMDAYNEFETLKASSLRDIWPGRIIYDIYEDVRRDQSLTGKVKNRKLKTIANYFGFGGYSLENEEYTNMEKLIGTQKLIDYNLSDVRITYEIGTNIYLPIAEAKAKLMDLPIGNILNCAPSYIPAVFAMRELTKRNIFPFEINRERYARFSTLMYKESQKSLRSDNGISKNDIEIIDIDDNDIITKTYEAAIVYQSDKLKGFIPKVEKYDFSGYYPSTIMTMNLGPETTRFVELQDITENSPLVEVKHMPDNILRVYVKDKNWNKIVVIDIDQKTTSFYKEILLKFKNIRKEIKAKLKTTTDKSLYNKLNAQQLAVKVLMNIFFGESGNKYSLYGDMSIAIAILGITRDFTTYICENVFTFDHIIEIDTDGMYLDKTFSDKLINDTISKYAEEKYHVKSYMSMDHEDFGRGYFMKKKTYVLEDIYKCKGKENCHPLMYKGSALKGSNKPLLFDKAVKYTGTELVLKETSDKYMIASYISNFANYKWPDDFIITQKFKKKSAYNTKSAMHNLYNVLSKYIEIRENESIEYIVTQNGTKPIQFIEKDDTYDYSFYYNRYIKGMLETFDLLKYLSGQYNLFD